MKLHLLAWLLPILLVSGDETENSNPAVVTIGQGKLEGLVLESRKGNKYYGFLGVPYGKAPVRFGVPQAPDSWEGTRMATKLAPHCYQFCLVQQKLVGVEDCLTLNIYTPKLDGNYPVMVQIHGGGFQFGTGSFTHGKYFADEEVVLVTIQYRLGALGFLNTEDDAASGNMGLKDQSTALRWLQENVKHFGGNPQKVSIFGFSAGGASVHYHMLSPMSKGLFSSAISQSGSALNPWAQQQKPKELAARLAESLGCTNKNSEKMVECLRNKKASEIVTEQMKFAKFSIEFDLISMLFTPSVEKGHSEPKFLASSPYSIVSKGKTESKVPWIAGVTAEEGAFYIAMIMENEPSVGKLNNDWFTMLPNILYYERIASSATQSRISKQVKEFYFGNKKIGQDDYVQLGRVFGDRFFNTGVSRAIREHAKNAEFPIYPYIFNYTTDYSIQQGFLYAKKSYGIGHADDLKFQFNKAFGAPEYNLDSEEGKFSENFIKLWVSFARDGKPTETWGSDPKWEPFVLQEDEEISSPVPWYVIDDEPNTIKEDPLKKGIDFWENLPLRELEKEDYPEERDEL